jgi:hypothetical protein
MNPTTGGGGTGCASAGAPAASHAKMAAVPNFLFIDTPPRLSNPIWIMNMGRNCLGQRFCRYDWLAATGRIAVRTILLWSFASACCNAFG